MANHKTVIMKNISLFFLLNLFASFLFGQSNTPIENQQKAIIALIDKYSEAREKSDTTLLKIIMTADIDQLVSNGEWRNGIASAVQGMLRSSAGTPGTRKLMVEKTRMIGSATAIVDCRYEIQNTDGTMRKMWSTFIVMMEKGVWKISAIRNMLPAAQ